MIIEDKNNTFEVWEVVRHIEKYLIPPMLNGVYPRTMPCIREGHRIEVNCLHREEYYGIINVLLYPSDSELYSRVEKVLDEAIIDDSEIYLKINHDNGHIPWHFQIRYEHTKRSRSVDQKL